MCMKIKEVPATEKDALCVPCKKVLTQRESTYITCFCQTPIPSNGLLVKRGKSPENYYGKIVNGGCIHSFLSKVPNQYIFNRCYMNSFFDKIFKAYAIGVIAYGTFGTMDSKIDNIISFAVYIPDLDKSSNKKERVHACENPTKQRLLKAFPKLGRFKNVFGS